MKKNLKMRKSKYLIIAVLSFCFIMAGCASETGFIVRHDIQENDIDYLYKNMSENEVFEVFGLPHKTNDFGVVTHYYLTENFNLELDMVNKKLTTATLHTDNGVILIDLPAKEEKTIIKGKYIQPVKQRITESDIRFISDATTSETIQEKLGAPYKIVPYHLDDGFLINSFVYQLEDGNTLRIIYKYDGTVWRVWIEDGQGNETEVLVELEGI